MARFFRTAAALLGLLLAGCASSLTSQHQPSGREVETRPAGATSRVPTPASSPTKKHADPQPSNADTDSPTTVPSSPASDSSAGSVVVTRVVDGDTVEVDSGGRVVDVRMIGVDTPESVAPGQPVECFARRASEFTERSLQGRRVRLEFDVQRTDRYGRTLAYVWLDGRLFNEVLLARGYAVLMTVPPNVRYADRFLAAYRHARERGRGVWTACDGEDDEPVPSCDSSYPDLCVPPPPPDLDCPDIGKDTFRVIGSDPHGVDGDRDGVGCEPPPPTTEEPSEPTDSPGGDCTPGYSPCLARASDYDCAGGSGDGPAYAAGPVRITGSDPYGLDSDGDGVGCED
jgi:micrococcal nuclease